MAGDQSTSMMGPESSFFVVEDVFHDINGCWNRMQMNVTKIQLDAQLVERRDIEGSCLLFPRRGSYLMIFHDFFL